MLFYSLRAINISIEFASGYFLVTLLFFFSLCKQLQKLVVENILAFNASFWIRLAARTDTCKSEDDKAGF